jgi:hypothetical protein
MTSDDRRLEAAEKQAYETVKRLETTQSLLLPVRSHPSSFQHRTK